MGRPLDVDKELKTPLDIVHRNCRALLTVGVELCRDDQVDRVSETRLRGDASQQFEGILVHVDLFFLASHLQDLTNVVHFVRLRRNDHETIQQIEWDAVWTGVVGPTDLGNTAVGGNDEEGCQFGLEGPIQEGKALHIEHVHFVNEQDARNQLGSTLLAPLGDLVINLITNLLPDLSRISRKESHVPLLP